MSDLVIRDAAPGDREDWRALWNGYLAFYETELDDAVTAMTWNRIIDPISSVYARLAVADGAVAGFATRVLHPRTWSVEPVCYLEDLFVGPAHRGKGIGRALIDDLIATGKRDGWSNLYWHTNHDNANARKLYDSYDEADGYVRYRLKL